MNQSNQTRLPHPEILLQLEEIGAVMEVSKAVIIFLT